MLKSPKLCASTLALLVGAAGQASQPKTRYRVARQLASVQITQLHHVNLGRTEGVVAQDQTRLVCIYQHIDRAHTFSAVLHRKSVKVIIQLCNTTNKPRAIVKRWV